MIGEVSVIRQPVVVTNLTNQKRVLEALTNQRPEFRVLTNQRPVLGILTNQRLVLTHQPVTRDGHEAVRCPVLEQSLYL